MTELIMDKIPCFVPTKWKARISGLSRNRYRNVGLCAFDLSCLHAACADIGLAHMAALVADGDFLNVGLEPAVRDAVRMADVTACRGLLTADLANLRHVINSV